MCGSIGMGASVEFNPWWHRLQLVHYPVPESRPHHHFMNVPLATKARPSGCLFFS